ncbi:dienelactone hydrolase family protein [Arthrobacter sp. KBS0702]|uniref:dienelactone hydrolase family protein n=1 Tax=Arthrobacter sp. KBS0702 TaxID=2578107 RepID=UPI00110DABE8|nr:dienelactone hydrolase family protein [Arthrobacter sp. KBS0702]QDW30749.1 dienelactone hydrolase family protein [Arthrobacter sp. KBS0702]
MARNPADRPQAPDMHLHNLDLSAASSAAGGSPQLRGYLAEPEGEGPFPAVLMVHEAFGLDDITVRHAERLAAAGYLVLAVDLYSDGGARRCLVSTMRSLAAGQGRAFTDLATARQWLLDSGRTTGKIGVIGFCMGGSFALLMANDGFDAAAVNYGRLPKDPETELAGACPIVANFGARDRTLPGAAARLTAALESLGVEHDIKEFETAGHAFLNDAEAGPRPLRPLFRVLGIGPDPQSAPEAWRRIEDHFARYLKD